MNLNLKYSDFNRFYSFHSKISRIIINNCRLIFYTGVISKKNKIFITVIAVVCVFRFMAYRTRNIYITFKARAE